MKTTEHYYSCICVRTRAFASSSWLPRLHRQIVGSCMVYLDLTQFFFSKHKNENQTDREIKVQPNCNMRNWMIIFGIYGSNAKRAWCLMCVYGMCAATMMDAMNVLYDTLHLPMIIWYSLGVNILFIIGALFVVFVFNLLSVVLFAGWRNVRNTRMKCYRQTLNIVWGIEMTIYNSFFSTGLHLCLCVYHSIITHARILWRIMVINDRARWAFQSHSNRLKYETNMLFELNMTG